MKQGSATPANSTSRTCMRATAVAMAAILLLSSVALAGLSLAPGDGGTRAAVGDDRGSRAAESPDEWLTFKGDVERTGVAAAEPPSVDMVLWTADYRPSTIYSSPAVWNETVYIGVASTIRAIWAKNGTERWTYVAPNPIHTALTVIDGVIYAGVSSISNNATVAVDALTGAELWFARIPDFVTSAPLVIGNSVYVGCQNGILYCLRTSDGRERWNFTTGTSFKYGSIAHSEDLIYTGIEADGDQNGKLYALRTGNGAEAWNATVVGSIWSSPCVAGDSVLVATAADKLTGGEIYNGYVYKFNKTTGSQEWRSENLGWVYASPTVAGDYVYVGTFGKIYPPPTNLVVIAPKMYRLKLSNGDINWSKEVSHFGETAKVWSSVTVAGTKIIFGDELGWVNVWSILGQKIWDHETAPGSAVKVTPAVALEMIFVANTRGDVIGFGSQPDLMVSATTISVEDQFPHLGQRVRVEAIVKNIGHKTATARVFLYNGSLEDWDTVINWTRVTLDPDRSTKVHAVWTADEVGNRATWVRIMDVVPNESNLSNNEAKRVLEVLPPVEGWLSTRSDPSGDGFMATEPPTNNLTKWLRAEGSSPAEGLVATTDLVYAPSGDRLIALDKEDGTVVWSTPLGGGSTTPPGIGDGAVLIGTAEGHVLALDLEDGTVRFDRALDGPVTAGPIVVAARAYLATSMGTDVGTLYCLDTFDGSEFWNRSMDAVVNAHPAVMGDMLYSVSDAGAILSLNATDGSLLWQFPVGTGPDGALSASPLVQDDHVFVASSSGFVYCLDADPSDGVDEGKEDSPGSTYDVIWTSKEDPLVPYNVSPALVDGRLVLVSGPDSVLALNASDGGQLWRARLPEASPLLMDVIAINDSVVVGGASLHILSAESGVETWNYDRPLGTLVGGPVALDGMLFAYDDRAIVYAFGKVENIPPVARIEKPLEDEAFRINESIVFDASISSDDKPLPDTSFFWDFGDGNTSFSKIISHRYTTDGVYRVEVTVTDTDGDSDNATVTIRILRNHRPTLDMEQVVPTQGFEDQDLFNFSVRYTDPDNDPPEFIVIRLVDEPGFQPINLLEVDDGDENYTDGKLYFLPKTLGSRPYPAVTVWASDGIATTETVFAGPRVLVTETFTNSAGNIDVTATYVGPAVLEFRSVVSPPTNFPTSLFPIGMYVELFLNTTYLKEASMTIHYEDFNITEFNVSTLSVYRWTVTDTDAEWRYIPTGVDEEKGLLTAEVLDLESDIYSVLGNKLKPPINRPPIPVLFVDGKEYSNGRTVDKTYKPEDPISFDGSGSYDPDTTLYDRVIEWVWDFGDGTELKVGKTATHSFSREGRYTIVLTLTDRFGGKNETRVTVLVTSEDEDLTIFYIAIAAIVILMILLFYPKGGGRPQEGGQKPSGETQKEPGDEEPLEKEDDLDEGSGTGELDSILDELEEDRGQRKERKS